ncbi:MAG: hypothetical protein ACLFWH_01955 [Actinomycetota bacterium]
MGEWRRSSVVALVAICLFAVVQFTIPMSRLGPPHVPERFAWQMFSNVPNSPMFEVETASGTEEVDVGRYLAQERADLDLTDSLPEHLCEAAPEAIRVTWEKGEHKC